jgi:hypothetical protein
MTAKRKAAKKKAASAGSAISTAKTNPYLQRIAADDDLRDNVRVAFEAARDAYGRLNHGKAPTKVLLDDRKFHKDLHRSAEAMRDVSDSLRTGKRKRSGMGLGTLLAATVIGGIVALVVSEDLRNKVLDMLFGAEEEFDYTSTTTPVGAPPPAQPVT